MYDAGSAPIDLCRSIGKQSITSGSVASGPNQSGHTTSAPSNGSTAISNRSSTSSTTSSKNPTVNKAKIGLDTIVDRLIRKLPCLNVPVNGSTSSSHASSNGSSALVAGTTGKAESVAHSDDRHKSNGKPIIYMGISKDRMNSKKSNASTVSDKVTTSTSNGNEKKENFSLFFFLIN